MQPNTTTQKRTATTIAFLALSVLFFIMALSISGCQRLSERNNYDDIDDVINHINQKHHFVCDTVLVEDYSGGCPTNLSAITSIRDGDKPIDCTYMRCFTPIINHSEIPKP